MNFSLIFYFLLFFDGYSVKSQAESFSKQNSKEQNVHYFQSSKSHPKHESGYLYDMKKHDEIPSTARSIPNSNFQTTGWLHTSNAYISEKEGQTLTVTYHGTRFWIIGSPNTSFENVFISLDNTELTAKASTDYIHRNNVVYYASPENTPFGEHIITLVTKDNRRVEVNDIKYLPYEINSKDTNKSAVQKHLSDLGVDYVNITAYNFSYYPRDKWKVYPETGAQTASFCEEFNASASVTFYGTKVLLRGKTHSLLGEMEIRLDGRLVKVFDAFSSDRNEVDIFKSEEFDYGQHTINITNKNSKDPSRIEIYYALVWPLPKSGGVRKNFQEIKSKSPLWSYTNYENDGFDGISTNTKTIDIPITFYGTKFWITGTGEKGHKKFQITIDNKDTFIIDSSFHTLTPLYSFLSLNCLLYQSGDLTLGNHEVLIKHYESTDYLLELADFFYITQPKNATLVPQAIDVAHQFNMYGTNFWIFGQQFQNDNIEIKVNSALTPFDIQSTDTKLNLDYLKPLDPIQIKYYSIEVITTGETEIMFAYYLNEEVFTPLPSAVEIGYDSTDISYKSWELLIYERNAIETEGISTKSIDSQLTIPFAGSQFWIEGSYDPTFGVVEIRLNGTFLSAVSLYREEHHKQQIYYQSDHIEYDNYELTLKNIDNKEISFNKLYVLTPSYLFSLSDYFSSSQSFTQSTDFTESTDFTQSTDFTESERFTKSSDFSNSNDFTHSETFSSSSRFTSSLSFTSSEDFTTSSVFSFSSDFTDSISFTPTESDIFSESVSFSDSASFSDSFLFSVLENSDGNKDSLPIGVIVGIVFAILAVILITVLIIMIILRRKKNDDPSDINSFECTATFPDTSYDHTKDDPIEGPDSFIPYDPFNQAIEEFGK